MRRTIALTLAALLCLGLAACGKDIPPLRPNETTASAATESADAPAAKEIFNNGGRYVKYAGDTYYWEYNAACLAPCVIWGETQEVPGIRRSMIRLTAGGAREGLFIENGCGGIWVCDGRFYLTWLDDDYNPQIISTAMEPGDATGTAKDRRELGPGEIFALDEARGLLIASVGRLNGNHVEYGLCVINTKTSARTDLHIPSTEPLLYDAASGTLYYRDFSIEDWYEDEIKLCRVDVITGEVWDVASFEPGALEGFEDADDFELDNARLEKETLHMFMSGYSGTGRHLMGCAYLIIDLDSKECRQREDSPEYMRFGVNRPFTLAESCVRYICDESGRRQPVLSEVEQAGFGLPEGSIYREEDFASVRDVEYVDGALFFSILRGPRNEAEDIGWRQAYDLESMAVYRKDVSTGRIEELYSFDKNSLRG